jgi:hypothetical protein
MGDVEDLQRRIVLDELAKNPLEYSLASSRGNHEKYEPRE